MFITDILSQLRLVRAITVVCGMSSVLVVSGCSQLGAKAYQRGNLAKPHMQLNSDAITASYDDHLYFSKEASSGGASFGGGGCGCN